MFHLEPSSIAPRSSGERSAAAKACSHTRTARLWPNHGALQTNARVRGSAWPADMGSAWPADIVLC